jgi:ankyrin repeat protein
MVKYLLSLFDSTAAERRAYVNRQNQSGNTALHWSALNGHIGIVKLLLAGGADASILNTSGHDAVYEAEMNDKQDVAEYLLKEALGLEKAIGGDLEGKEEEDEEMMEAESSASAARVADGMAEMDLKGSETQGQD